MAATRTSQFQRRDRAAAQVAGVSAGMSPPLAVGLIAGLVAASWLVSYAVGGAGPVPPHWFYVPIIFTALRFGGRATLVTSIVSGLVAGPLLPLDVSQGTSQTFSDWGMRTAFFVGIGQVLALLIHQPQASRVQALRFARTDRALETALTTSQLEVHYQPVYDVLGRRRRIVGAEALVRWRHPKRGLVLPAEFIPAAEHTGRIVDIGEFVLHDACRRIDRWGELCSDRRFQLSVNLSGRELADPDLIDRVAAALREHGVQPGRLTFEVTETAIMEDMELCLTQLAALRELGVNLSIDDFGTGQSSLQYVQLFPVQTVKLDGSFTARMTHDVQGQAMMGTMILLAHTLELQAVAEGIETAEQLELLKAMRCDFGQGYHLARPMPPDDVTERLADQHSRRRDRIRKVERAL